MTTSTQIRLVVMTASQNDAERIASHLRNAGHVVHADWISDIDQLDALLPQADLVLCASENLPKAKLKDVADRCRQLPRHVLVVAMNDTIDIGRTTQAMRSGARDLVSLQQMEHLQAVVLRELEHAHVTRSLQEVNSRLQQAETRHDSLLQDSAEALAYIQEGIHIRVNPAYSKLFGYSDIKSVKGLPLMDLIVIEDRPK
ncbi:MAG: PAS domain S-box protein, partial [Nevskiales bacterium]